MTTIANTKKEIVTEIQSIARYLSINKLFDVKRSESSLIADSKENLIELRQRMIAVVIGDITRRGAKGEVPELKDQYYERCKRYEELKADCKEKLAFYDSHIQAQLEYWLGMDLKFNINDYVIYIGIPDSEEGGDVTKLHIDMYYRESWTTKDGQTVPGEGSFEVNQPTFGAWNPRNPKNTNIKRFFQVLAKMFDTENGCGDYMDTIRAFMDNRFTYRMECQRMSDKIENDYKEAATAVAAEMVRTMDFEDAVREQMTMPW